MRLEPSKAHLRVKRCRDNVKAGVMLHHQALRVGVELLKTEADGGGQVFACVRLLACRLVRQPEVLEVGKALP